MVIANVWDAGSARVLAGLGFAAIASSSYATAGAYGTRDGRITRDQALAPARAIVDATDLPVSADLESGFGTTANDVAETYRHAAAVNHMQRVFTQPGSFADVGGAIGGFRFCLQWGHRG